MGISLSIDTGRARDAAFIEFAGDSRHAHAGEAAREDPSHVRSGQRVGIETPQATSPSGVHLVRVRTGVHEPVPVRGPAAEVAALLAGLDAHRGQDTVPCTQHLTSRLRARHHHERTVRRLVHVDGTERLRQPQPDAVGVQEGSERGELLSGERAFVLPDHNGIEGAVRQGFEQCRRLWTS